MREQFVRHFDVVVVIWALTLCLGWTLAALSRSQLSDTQWSCCQQSGPVWVVPDGGGSN